jgi:type IV pilus assembly protein PilO
MKNWPWYGYLLLAAIVFGLFYFIYFKPKNTELQGIRADREKVENEVQSLRLKKKQLDKIEADIASLNKTLKELEVIIPQRKEISDILRRIQQLALDSRLNVIRFAPRGEIPKEFYAEWPIPIEVSGSYHNLGIFFDRLSSFARLFIIENFSIRALPQQAEAATIGATFTAKTYYFLEEPPASPEAKK